MRAFVVASALVFACGSRSDLNDYTVKGDDASMLDSSPPNADAAPPLDVGVPDVLQTGPVATPRPLAPLSTSSVTTQKPTFHWLLPAGVDGARVEICSSRDCSAIEQIADAVGDHAAPSSPLLPGLHFYRLRGIAGNVVGTATSATMEFVVPHRSTPRDTTWGTFPDLDGDGFADLVVAGKDQNGARMVTVFPGSSSGVHHKIRVDVTVPISEDVISVASAGDVDGDGFVDLVLSMQTSFPQNDGGLLVYRGGPSGITANQKPVVTIPEPTDAQHVFGSATSAGDVNGDGYSDIIAVAVATGDSAIDRYVIFFGGPQGPSTTPSITLDGDGVGQAVGCGEGGDVDGDGFPDIVALTGGTELLLYRGGPMGPSTASRTLIATMAYDCASSPVSPTPGDLNGDGFADIAVMSPGCGTGAGAFAEILYGGTSISKPTFLGVPEGYSGFDATIQLAGDIDGDGYDDLVAGMTASFGVTKAGLWFAGSPVGVSGQSGKLVSYSPVPTTGSAWVYGVGDIDRDGRADVVLSTIGSFLTVFGGATPDISYETEVGPLPNGTFSDAFR